MSNLQHVLVKAKEGLAPWQQIPASKWPEIARQCGEPEVKELHARIAALHAELEAVESWDGDTQIDIQTTIQFFEQLILLAAQGKQSPLP